MKLAIILWIIAIYGFIITHNNPNRNFIFMLICLELMLLAVSLLLLFYSINYDDLIGQIFSLYTIAIAGAESAIGLAILVSYFRLRGNISLHDSRNYDKVDS